MFAFMGPSARSSCKIVPVGGNVFQLSTPDFDVLGRAGTMERGRRRTSVRRVAGTYLRLVEGNLPKLQELLPIALGVSEPANLEGEKDDGQQ